MQESKASIRDLLTILKNNTNLDRKSQIEIYDDKDNIVVRITNKKLHPELLEFQSDFNEDYVPAFEKMAKTHEIEKMMKDKSIHKAVVRNQFNNPILTIECQDTMSE